MTHNKFLILILLAAAALRLYDLGGESLWLDESLTIVRVEEPLRQLVGQLNQDTQFPLFYVIDNIYCSLAGISETTLRLPSAIFGIFAVLAIYLLGRELLSVRAGLFAASLLAVNPFAIYYSQDARPYSLFLMTSLFSIYFAVRLYRKIAWKDVVGYVAFTTATLYSHNFGPLVLLIHAVGLFAFGMNDEFEAARKKKFTLIAIAACAVVLYLPLIAFTYGQIARKVAGVSPASWIPVPDWKAFPQTAVQYFMNRWIALGAVSSSAVFTTVVLMRDRGRNARLWFVWTIILSLTLVPWIASKLLTPVYVPRYTIPALAGFSLLLGWTLAEIRPAKTRMIAGLVCLIISCFPLFEYYAYTDKEPWRETAKIVKEHVLPGDLIVVHAPFCRRAFEYYFGTQDNVEVIAPGNAGEIPAKLSRAPRVWLVQAYKYIPEFNNVLFPLVQQGRTAQSTYRVNDMIHANPDAFWIAEIRVTLYTTS